jgi:hypothetical protein
MLFSLVSDGRVNPPCRRCGSPRSLHGEEQPYDFPEEECEGFEYCDEDIQKGETQ